MSLKSRLNQLKNTPAPQEQAVHEPETDEILRSHPDVDKLMIFSYKESYVKTEDGIFASNLKFSSPGALLKEIKRVSGLAGVDFRENSFFKINNGIVVKSFLPPLTKDVCGILSRETERQIQDTFISDDILVYLKECVESQKNILITGPSEIDKEALLSLLTELVDDEKTFIICDKYSKMKTGRKTFVFSLFDSKSVAITDYDTIFVAEPTVDEFLEMAGSVICGKKGIITAMTLKDGDVAENLKMLFALRGVPAEEAENLVFSTFDVLINCGLDENETPYIRSVISTNPLEKIYIDPSEPEIEENTEELNNETEDSEPESESEDIEADYVFDLSTPKKKAQILKEKIKRKKFEQEAFAKNQIQTEPEFSYGTDESSESGIDFEEVKITAEGVDENEDGAEKDYDEVSEEQSPEAVLAEPASERNEYEGSDTETVNNEVISEETDMHVPEEEFNVEVETEDVSEENHDEITIEPEIIAENDLTSDIVENEAFDENSTEPQQENKIDVESVEIVQDKEVLPEADFADGILPSMPVMTAKKTRIKVKRKPGNSDKFNASIEPEDDLFDAPEEFVNNDENNNEN